MTRINVDELLARLQPPPALTPVQVARIRSRIDDQPQRRLVMWRFAVVLVVILFGTTAIAMYVLSSRPTTALRVQVPLPAPEPDLDSPPITPTTLTANLPPAPTPPVEAMPAAKTAPPRAPAPAATVADREGTLGAESRLLATALRQLRQQHNAREAIATLDAYSAQFPRGVLLEEARAARIEALLALGNKRGALALLDAGSVKSDLAVARGELRLEVGRVQEAARDFESALIGAADEVEQRALFGRAACRVRLGDEPGARRDLEEYLRRFPHGASAGAAKRVLDRIR